MQRVRYVNPQAISKSLRCSICLDPFFEPIRTPCGHAFCKQCLESWIQKKASCPLDQQPLPSSSSDFRVDFVLAELLAEYEVGCLNDCSWTGLQTDLKDHLSSVCPNQKVCSYCCF